MILFACDAFLNSKFIFSHRIFLMTKFEITDFYLSLLSYIGLIWKNVSFVMFIFDILSIESSYQIYLEAEYHSLSGDKVLMSILFQLTLISEFEMYVFMCYLI